MADMETRGWRLIEMAQKAMQDMVGVPDALLRDAQAGQAIMRLNADGTVSRVAPEDFYECSPLPQPPEAEK